VLPHNIETIYYCDVTVYSFIQTASLDFVSNSVLVRDE